MTKLSASSMWRFFHARDAASLGVKYGLFAVCSMVLNLGSQWVVKEMVVGPLAIYPAILVGTATGLIVKYVLDKRYIFFFATRDKRHDLSTFLLYTVMGVFTTGVFWGTELLFHFAFPDPGSAYLGGLLGLSIGYTAKYFLDRRWVFQTAAS